MLSFHTPRDDHQARAEPGDLPPWDWQVVWTEDDPRMIALPRDVLWPTAWLRMGATHHGIKPAVIERADGRIIARWSSHPDAGHGTPVWQWMVAWDAKDADWESAADDTLWYEAWQRMRSEHEFITPADLARKPTPAGLVTYSARWQSRPTPGDGPVMPQTRGCYEVWHKVADSWNQAQREAPRPGPPHPWRLGAW